MCSINHDLKSIYIHIPKCGGLFVQTILERHYNFKTFYFTHEMHENFLDNDYDKRNETVSNKELSGFLYITKKGLLSYFMSSIIHNNNTNMTIEKWKEYKKFTIIRNPYDRVVSSWKFLQKHNQIDLTFNDFLDSSHTIDGYSYFHSFLNQYEQLLDINNNFDIDYIGTFENLNEDLCDILLKIGVDKIMHRRELINDIKLNNSDSSNENYAECYINEIIIEKVNKLFYNDFENFKQFNKFNSIEEIKEDSKKYFIPREFFSKRNISLVNKLGTNDKITNNSIINNFKNKKSNKNNDNFDNMTNNISNNIYNNITNNIILENGLNINLNAEEKNTFENKTTGFDIIFENENKEENESEHKKKEHIDPKTINNFIRDAFSKVFDKAANQPHLKRKVTFKGNQMIVTDNSYNNII
jgi:hypothetical protein